MAPQFKSPEKKIYHVARHETVELPCVVEAAPKPTIHWVDANDQPILLVDGKVELFSDNSLKIYHVDHTDERVYYCNVSNKYGINRAESTLFVYDPLYFRQVPSPQRLEVDAHGSLELRCEAVADSRLTLRYLWTLNGRPFDFLPDMEEQASVLRLIDIRGRSTGRIECTAITEIGQKKSHMDLIVKDVPEPPSEVRLTCQPRSALISWKSASEHGSPVNEYRIEMKNNFQLDDKWQQVLLEEAGDKKEYEAQVTLSPWVNYTFRIIALNSYREKVDQLNFHCETQPNVPFTNPQNVRVAGTKPDNLVIRWDPLPKMEWNAPGLRYQIKYRLKEPHAKWTEFLIEDPLADHTILRERPTFKEYEVRIRAVNERGQSSQPPEIYTGFSGEDVPLEAPADLSLVSIDDYDQITVRWNAVNPETVRGHFKGYKVTYWINDNPYYSESVVVGAQNLSAQLKGLKALTNYTVEVRAVNGQYESPSSFTIQLSTPEGRPSEVTNLKVFAVGAQSMLATWNPPAEPNGNIRGYFVQFENSSSPSQIGESYVLYNQLHYLSEQLEPDSAYIFRVWAETNGGEGAKRSALFRTFQLRDPDPPLFSVMPFKSHSFLVKWQAPDPTNYSFPGTTFHLKYTLAGSDQWNTTEEIALPKRELILDGLQSQQEYWIIGVARENDRRAQSLRFKVLTGGGLGLSHFNPENLREAAWFIAILVVLALILIILAICCCCAQCRVSGRYSVQKREKQFGLIGVGADESGEYQKFLEYHHLGASSNDPPTISVSLADSTLEGRAKRVPMQVLQEEDIVVLADDKNDSPPLSRHGETDKLLPKK
ncbi:Neuroglian [Aphelenchoides bicaudatus]|nr:Neuroglian [Aphelenchoides bicaudatus]